jgi:Ca-activated chloride channel family protein
MLTTRHRSSSACCLALVAAALIVSSLPAVRAQSNKTRIFVSVTDAKGKSVKGLTKDDFTVKLDGGDQEVLSVQPATEPASIVILTDRLGIVATYPAYEAHAALGQFVKGIRAGIPDSRLALMTFDGTVITLNDFSSGPAELDRNLGKLTSVAQDAVLLDGMFEAAKVLRTAPTPRKVIFTVVAGYRPDQSNVTNTVLGEVLRLSGAQVWVIEVRSAQGGNWANNAREQVLDRSSRLSGGMIDIVSSPNGLEAMCKQMAEQLTGQYDLTYGPGGGVSASQLTVNVKQAGLKVLAPIWTDR